MSRRYWDRLTMALLVVGPTVIVHSVAICAAICNTYFQRPIHSKGHNRITLNSDRSPAGLTAIDRPHNSAHQTVVALRLDAIRFATDCVSVSVDDDRFQIQDQVVVGCYPHNQFGLGASRNGHASVFAPHFLVDGPVVNAIVRPIHVIV